MINLSLNSIGLREDNVIRLDRIVERTPATVEITPADLTAAWLIKTYFFGIPLTDQFGNRLPNDVIEFNIGMGIDKAQNEFKIRILHAEVDEQHDFTLTNWTHYVYIQLWNRPVIEIKKASVMIGHARVSEIPKDWIVVNRHTGEMWVLPILPGYFNIPIEKIWSFYIPQMLGMNYMPAMLFITSKVGMEVIDKLLVDYIGMNASIQIFNILGDIVLGAGIASISLSIEGLSQSIGTTSSAENSAYSARIRMYLEQLKVIERTLRSKYSVPSATVID